MFIQEIAVETIDLEDETFRISEELDPPALRDSLAAVGQLNPILLLNQNSRNRIVCGFRRIRAIKSLGAPAGVLARVLQDNACDPVRAYTMAVQDNVSHRRMTPLESARILFKLRHEFGLHDSVLIREYLPLLGLSPAGHVLQSYLALHRMHPALRRCLSDGLLTLSSSDILADLPQSVQERFAVLLGKIRLSASLQRKFLALLEDLAAEGHAFDAVLGRPEIVAIEEDPRLSPFQKGEKVHEFVYHLRNPKLSQAADQFLARKKNLRLAGPIHITAHPFFEEPGLRVEFEAPNAARFRELAASLHRAAESPELEELFKI